MSVNIIKYNDHWGAEVRRGVMMGVPSSLMVSVDGLKFAVFPLRMSILSCSGLTLTILTWLLALESYLLTWFILLI